MFSKTIIFKNFKYSKKNLSLLKSLQSIISKNNQVLNSLSNKYNNNFTKKNLKKFKSFSNFRVIGMGGSSLGAQAIYDFLSHKIKKKFLFIDNLQSNKKNLKKAANLIISKSGNTLETIVNTNILVKKSDKNIFITENKKNYLHILAEKMKSDIIHHNNFIGGRYSVLSEVGMVPAELMGLQSNYFKQLNNLIKKKEFLNSLVSNVDSTLLYLKQKKFNSIIINYDEKSEKLFKWYQQLLAESLGKKKKRNLAYRFKYAQR